MKLQVGDLVQYLQGPERLGIVTLTHTTTTGAEVCEVVVVHDINHPSQVGQKRYSNQDYWKLAEASRRPLDVAIENCIPEYEETLNLHKTYGES